MESLRARILRDGRNLGGGILKVDAFLNHQLDPELTLEMGREFRTRFEDAGVREIDKIVTAEVSGIAPALATGLAFGVPVVYARKKRPVTMPANALQTEAPSHTKGGSTPLILSPEYLRGGERVVLVDDFLASGRTVAALAALIARAGAKLLGIGCVIEKGFEGGRALLAPLGVPVISLASVVSMEGDDIELAVPPATTLRR